MSPGLVGMFLMSLAVNNRWVVSPCPLVSVTPGHLGGAPLSPSCQHCQCEDFIPTQIMKTSDWIKAWNIVQWCGGNICQLTRSIIINTLQFIIHHSLENLFPPIRRHQAAEFSLHFPQKAKFNTKTMRLLIWFVWWRCLRGIIRFIS